MTTRRPISTSRQRNIYVGSGLFVVAAIIVLVALFVWPGWLRGSDDNDNNNDTPASSGQQATPTQEAPAASPTPVILTETRVREIATQAAQQAIKDTGLATRADVKQIISDAVAQAVLAFQNGSAKTPSDVTNAATGYVQKQAQLAGGGSATQPVNLGAFPKTAQEASAAFGGDASRWEATAEGGWHMREEPFSVVINPRGFLAEGYFDTKPGKNPQCFAFVVPMGVQGATVWPEAGTRANAEKLQGKMAIPKWDDGQSSHPCQVMAP